MQIIAKKKENDHKILYVYHKLNWSRGLKMIFKLLCNFLNSKIDLFMIIKVRNKSVL